MKRLTILWPVLLGVITISAPSSAEIPMNGIFDTVIDPCDPCSPGISFEPLPYTGSSVYLWPFASDDGTYTPPYSNHNLAQALFDEGSILLTDYYEQTGDLGVRIANLSGTTQTFESSVLTLDFIDASFDVYIPGFTFEWSEEIFFWIAESGATYYANSSKDVGLPDMSAGDAMAAGDEYLARIPEPATLILFGLGGLMVRRKRS